MGSHPTFYLYRPAKFCLGQSIYYLCSFHNCELFKGSHAEHVYFFLGEEAPVTTTQVFLRKAAELYTVELHNTVTEVLEDTTHDAVLA